jgi:hypothetical protein
MGKKNMSEMNENRILEKIFIKRIENLEKDKQKKLLELYRKLLKEMKL